MVDVAVLTRVCSIWLGVGEDVNIIIKQVIRMIVSQLLQLHNGTVNCIVQRKDCERILMHDVVMLIFVSHS